MQHLLLMQNQQYLFLLLSFHQSPAIVLHLEQHLPFLPNIPADDKSPLAELPLFSHPHDTKKKTPFPLLCINIHTPHIQGHLASA